MTKKDYIIIAQAIKEAWALIDESKNIEAQEYAMETVILCLVSKMKVDNARFDEDKFRKFLRA